MGDERTEEIQNTVIFNILLISMLMKSFVYYFIVSIAYVCMLYEVTE